MSTVAHQRRINGLYMSICLVVLQKIDTSDVQNEYKHFLRRRGSYLQRSSCEQTLPAFWCTRIEKRGRGQSCLYTANRRDVVY